MLIRNNSVRVIAIGATMLLGSLGAYQVANAATSQSMASLPANPESGLTDAQRATLQAQEEQAFERRYTTWVNGLRVGAINLHRLPRVSLNASVVPGQATLRRAVSAADLIVAATVSSIMPTPFSGTYVNLTIDQTIKGPASSSLIIDQAGGLRPTPDWSGIVIAQLDGESMLLPGDRAVLLLEKSPTGGYFVQSVSGSFSVVNGLIQPTPLNPFGQSIAGLTEGAFIQQVIAANN